MISIDKLRSCLSYDPATGVFTWQKEAWLMSGFQVVKIGDVAGSLNGKGYWRVNIEGRTYQAHRLAWYYVYGEWPKGIIDHVNGIKTDNRIGNLRTATASQNTCNSKLSCKNTSGRKGVTWNKSSKKWQAHIKVNRKTIYIGVFDTVEKAHAAYCTAAIEHHGAFARLA